MKLNKAVVAVAGNGTRRYPIARVIEKCMMPILNRPVVEYVVKDLHDAGVRTIIFVVQEGSSQVEDYFTDPNIVQDADHLKDIEFSFVPQTDSRYGTAVPLSVARPYIEGEEHFAVVMGDDFIHSSDGSSEYARLIDALEGSKSRAGMMAVEIDPDKVSSFGVVELEDNKFIRIVEKPTPKDAPSNLINVSKYIFPNSIFTHLDHVMNSSPEGEYHITEVLNEFSNADESGVHVHRAEGKYLDAGSLENWVNANDYLLRQTD